MDIAGLNPGNSLSALRSKAVFIYPLHGCLMFNLCTYLLIVNKLSVIILSSEILNIFHHFKVQAHGSDAMVDEENCVFFLPHRPRSQIMELPFFLFMKGTGNGERDFNTRGCYCSFLKQDMYTNERSNQISTCRLVWCWSWPLWTPDCSSFRPCFPRKGCCGTVSVRLPIAFLQFCGVEIENRIRIFSPYLWPVIECLAGNLVLPKTAFGPRENLIV